MKTRINFLSLVLLFSCLSCTQSKKNYGPDDYLYSVIDTSGKYSKYERYGYIDKDGRMAIPFGKYYFNFTDTIKTIGFVFIGKGGFWAITKNDEKLFRVLPHQNGPDEIHNGLFGILDDNDMIGFANMKGEVVIPPRYTSVTPFYDSVTTFCKGCQVWHKEAFNDETDRSIGIKIIRMHGDTLILDRTKKYGIINMKGDTLLPPVYEKIGHFANDITLVYKKGRPFYIDISGKEVNYDAKKHPKQKPLKDYSNKPIKYIDGWENLIEQHKKKSLP